MVQFCSNLTFQACLIGVLNCECITEYTLTFISKEIKNVEDKKNESLVFCRNVFCLIFPTTIYALSDDGQEVSPADKQKIFEKLKELSKDTYAIIATVNQEKQLVMLKEKISVDGTVTMQKPNMFRWEMVRPAKSITVIDGEEMTVYTPESKEAQVYSLSDNTMARTTMKFFSTTMWGSTTEMEKRFAVKTFRKEGK